LDNRNNPPAEQRRPDTLNLNQPGEEEVNFYAVPKEWDDAEGMEFLEDAHEALLKLQQKTHKRAQVHRKTKPIEGWH